ncbi:NTP transferase domain-containing protein [Candidatus Woesearchaeota archaeon]|nr:NTP transferase domain-containing protein [Candidatus Woesearchaeota archaeon]
MKAVILAAGKSTRLHPLTVNRSKVMLPVANETILEYDLQQLQQTRLIDEVVIVVGFGSEEIIAQFGNNYGSGKSKIKLAYAFQTEPLGTGHALLQAEKFLAAEKKFLVIMGDDLYGGNDIKKCLRHDSCVLAKKVENISSFGKVVAEKGILKKLVEKPDEKGSGLANTGCYVLPNPIFQLLRKMKKSSRGEFEVVDAIRQLQNVHVEEAVFWQPITYPWSLLDANEALLKQREKDKPQIEATAKIERYATLKGFVAVGKNTLIRNGAYIEGPVVIGEDCRIGPNCYIRAYTSIGNGCRIGNAVEVKNAILMDNVTIGHLSYCADSVVGKNVNFGAGTITANLRHDNGPVKSMAKGELISTERRKFGTIIGDNAKTGIHTSIYPGRKIWPGKATLPGEAVRTDVT